MYMWKSLDLYGINRSQERGTFEANDPHKKQL